MIASVKQDQNYNAICNSSVAVNLMTCLPPVIQFEVQVTVPHPIVLRSFSCYHHWKYMIEVNTTGFNHQERCLLSKKRKLYSYREGT